MAFQAKRTKYGDQWFKSNLEAKTAESFDRLGIRWEYESRCFRDPNFAGGQYTPDFYLPDNFTYIEVVGRPDGRHIKNAFVFCETQNALCAQEEDYYKYISEDKPAFAFLVGGGYLRTPMQILADYNGSQWPNENLWISQCKDEKCRRFSFVHPRGSYGCKICGFHDGDHTIVGENLFDLAGMRYA